MGMRKRRYNECLCRQWCARPGSRWRTWVKHYTIRIDRVEGKEQIAEQLDDYHYGVGPDEYGLGNWVYR